MEKIRRILLLTFIYLRDYNKEDKGICVFLLFLYVVSVVRRGFLCFRIRIFGLA